MVHIINSKNISNASTKKLFFVLAFTVSQRHWLLEESIGTMDIENQAFRQLWILLSVGTVSLVFCSILSCIMFKWINSSLHPYIEIIADQIKEEKTVKNVQQVVLVSISPLNTEWNQTSFTYSKSQDILISAIIHAQYHQTFQYVG